MKKKTKIALWIICILLQEIIVIFGTFFFYDYAKAKQRIEELAEEPYFTKDELTADEVELFLEYYHGIIVPKWEKQWYIPHWPDYSYYTFYSGENENEKRISVLNYWLFIEKNDFPQEIEDIVSKCGLSLDEPIAKGWEAIDIREALELAIAMDELGKDLKNQGLVDEAYMACIHQCNVTVAARTQISKTIHNFKE